MSKDENKPPFLPSPFYDVGYGKPPEGTRFKKGQSGNPKGRPVGSLNRRFSSGEEHLFDAVRKEAARTITVRGGTEEVEMPMIQAAFRTWMVKAVQGSARHGELVVRITTAVEAHDRRQYEQLAENAIAYKVYWEEELERRRRRRIFRLPDPVPHPNQILVDSSTGDVAFIGPLSRQEKAEWEAKVAVERRLVDEEEASREATLDYMESKSGGDPDILAKIDKGRQDLAIKFAKERATIADFEAMHYLDPS